MPYEDYLLEWKVLPPFNPLAKCQPGQIVTFTGGPPPKPVIVSCNGTSPYGEGIYMEPTDTIERKGEYVIRMNREDPKLLKIDFCPQGSLTGSWTAEDNGGWDGSEDG